MKDCERLPERASAFWTSASSSRVRWSYSIEAIATLTMVRPRSVDQRYPSSTAAARDWAKPTESPWMRVMRLPLSGSLV